ncbi:MAG TPA: PIN domain-containing protein [Thermoanaerobaculia bacterium]|nr:PIN domain-containing protein [Thermoanaerobaculia bacterium]
MTWVVDASVLIDVLEDDPELGESSARTLENLAVDGLTICPVTYVELAPAFEGSRDLQEEFLAGVGVRLTEGWTRDDTVAAFAAWYAHVQRRRRDPGPRRPVADILIGAFAQRFKGLVTRNEDHFRPAFPLLKIRTPAA